MVVTAHTGRRQPAEPSRYSRWQVMALFKQCFHQCSDSLLEPIERNIREECCSGYYFTTFISVAEVRAKAWRVKSSERTRQAVLAKLALQSYRRFEMCVIKPIFKCRTHLRTVDPEIYYYNP